MIDFNVLNAPFPTDMVSWRPGKISKDGTKAMALAYIDARDVMDRLDNVCGPAGWQCKYSHANGKTICDIAIKCDNEWIWKADGAGDSDIEAEKGAMSDAFKRAAVRFGIGRYLYGIKTPWVAIDEFKKITDAELERLRKFLPSPDGHLNVGMPGLSKKPAGFWSGLSLLLEVPKKSQDAPNDVKTKWLVDEFKRGIEKAPTRELLAKFQTDNSSWIDKLPSELTHQLYDTCSIRANQFDNH